MKIRMSGSLEIELKSEKMINIFIVGLLLLPIYIKFMNTLSGIIHFPTIITTYIYYGGLWGILLFSLSGILRQVNQNIIVGSTGVILLLAVSDMFYPESKSYIMGGTFNNFILFSPESLLFSMLFVFVGNAVSNFEHLRNLLHIIGRVGVTMGAMSYLMMLISSSAIHYDDMSTAYAICVLLCIIIVDWRKWDIIFVVLGIASLIIAGTRGPLVCMLVTWIIKTTYTEKNKRKRAMYILLICLIIILVYSGAVFKLLLLFGEGLAKFGLTDLRIIDYINDGMLLDGSGREDFFTIMIEAIARQPLLGYGIGGDRIVLDDHYAHNIIFESLISLGIFFGTLFPIWVLYLFVRAMRASDNSIKFIIAGLFGGTVVKLMMSSSVIVSREFFLFLGICIAAGRMSKQKQYFPSDNGL